MSSEQRRDDRVFRAVWRELRKPRVLLSSLRKSGGLTVPLIFAGPTFVLLSYIVTFGVTPADRASAEFHSAASQIIPVLLLVLAVEGQVFRWEMAPWSLSAATREDVVGDARFQRFAAGEGPIADAVEAVLDAAVDTARNVADALLRQTTSLLLLASMLVGEVIALIPLLTDDAGSVKRQAGDGGDRRRLRRRRLCRDHGIEISCLSPTDPRAGGGPLDRLFGLPDAAPAESRRVSVDFLSDATKPTVVTGSIRRRRERRASRRTTCRCGSHGRDVRRAGDGAHRSGLSPCGPRG